MKALRLLPEALRIAYSMRVQSLVAATVVAVACGTLIATVGRNARTEADVLARIDDQGSLQLRVFDPSGMGVVPSTAVERIAQLDGVSAVLGVGPSRDATNPAVPGSPPVAVRVVAGDLRLAGSLGGQRGISNTDGLAGPGALARAGIDTAAGGLLLPSGDSISIVGSFDPAPSFRDLQDSVLVGPDPAAREFHLRTILLEVTSAELAGRVASALPAVLGAQDPSQVAVESSPALVAARSAVAGELNENAWTLTIAVFAIGQFLVAVSAYGQVIGRRRDFGRRRALGASRPEVVAVIIFQYAFLALVGGAVGVGVGSLAMWYLVGSVPTSSFTGAVVALGAIVGVVGSAIPAGIAAARDPVAVLRVP